MRLLSNKQDSEITRDIEINFDKTKKDLADYLGVDIVEYIMIHPEDERPRWAKDRIIVLQAVQEFVKFIKLAIANPNQFVAPSKLQDDIWHQFMLHPQKYYNFCIDKAGRIIDHNGGFGLREGEKSKLIERYTLTQRLWKETYKEDHPALNYTKELKKYGVAAACCAENDDAGDEDIELSSR
jgi:hypothetical protein